MFELRLVSREEVIEDEDVIVWRLVQGNTIIANINKVLNKSIIECTWIDKMQEYICVEYYEWNDSVHVAILRSDGVVIRTGIRSIEKYISHESVFLVIMTGLGLGENDAFNYNLEHDDYKFAVIDINGNFVLPPIYDSIKYYQETRGIFKTNFKTFHIVNGKELNEDELWE